MVDLMIAFLSIIIMLPLFLIIAILVRIFIGTPILFKQQRPGRNEKLFTLYKFRMMSNQKNSQGDFLPDEERLNQFGEFLRTTSLDELPQVFNVLQGSMSIVGPRPHAVAHNELYREQIKGYMLRHKIKPGITGWAQVNGWRGETDTLEKMQKRVEFDLHYIRHWSLAFDIKIVLLTMFRGFRNANAY